MKGSILAFAALATAQQRVLQSEQQKPISIAIVGSGAAGASTAYHLSKFASNSSSDCRPLNITVFERNNYIGGRSTTVPAYEDESLPVELGASIFVSVNHILANAVEEFNLSTSTTSSTRRIAKGPQLAIWDGQKILLTQNGNYFDYARLWWRYGTAPLRTVNLMKKVVGKFLQMYEEPIFPWATGLSEAAQAVGLTAVTAATGEQYIRENGIEGPFAREVVQAATRVNYAQNLGAIHGLEAMVSMAADGAMSVEGGNWRIFEAMIKASGAELRLGTVVDAVEKTKDGKFLLSFGEEEQHFDAVVIAGPWQYAEIDVKGLGLDREPDKVPYVELHVTLFTSPHLLSPTFFNLGPGDAAPKVILTTLPEGEPPKRGPDGVGSPGFFSISLLRPITNPETGAEEFLYKIFSPKPVGDQFLADVLDLHQEDRLDIQDPSEREADITWIFRKVWNSYPYELPRVTFEEVELEEGLWYTGGMDSFISTMETNALMGMNVARLMVDRWGGKEGKVTEMEDESVLIHEDV